MAGKEGCNEWEKLSERLNFLYFCLQWAGGIRCILQQGRRQKRI